MVKALTCWSMMVVTWHSSFWKEPNGKPSMKRPRNSQIPADIPPMMKRHFMHFWEELFLNSQTDSGKWPPKFEECQRRPLLVWWDFTSYRKGEDLCSQLLTSMTQWPNRSSITFTDADIHCQMVFSEPLMWCLLVREYWSPVMVTSERDVLRPWRHADPESLLLKSIQFAHYRLVWKVTLFFYLKKKIRIRCCEIRWCR